LPYISNTFEKSCRFLPTAEFRFGAPLPHVITPVDELPPGTQKFLTIDARPIAVFNIKGEIIRCPRLGWGFDIRTPPVLLRPNALSTWGRNP
jgi:hypothetical protein